MIPLQEGDLQTSPGKSNSVLEYVQGGTVAQSTGADAGSNGHPMFIPGHSTNTVYLWV